MIFALLVVNFIAVSLSLSCNRDSNILVRIFSVVFAFVFGIIYIVINYGFYKVPIGDYCEMCKQEPFPFFNLLFYMVNSTIFMSINYFYFLLL